MITRMVFVSILVFLITGCATAPPLNTASGRPEVTITGVTTKQVINFIANRALSLKGAQVRNINDYSITVGRPSDSVMVNAVFGSNFNRTVEERIVFNVLETPGGVRVVASASYVTNPGSGFEKVEDMTGGKLAWQMQNSLEELRVSLSR